MSRAIAVALALAASSTGCFTSWVAIQATGSQRILDEGVREEVVPQPGVVERLALAVPLTIEYEAPAPSTASTASTATTPTTPTTPAARTPLPFAIRCAAAQHGKDVAYRSAFRYGSRWKKATAIAFVIEAATAGALLLVADREDPNNVAIGAFFAADALGTAALFFVPRKEIYRADERPVSTPLRADCPDGLAIEIGGDAFAIDAAGRIGELGEAALDEWMTAPRGSLLVTFEGRTSELRIGPAEQCAWRRARDPQAAACQQGGYLASPRTVGVTFEVPLGTLTVVASE